MGHAEETVGLWSAPSMKGQGLVNILIREVTVSKVRGERPVCRAVVRPGRLITLSLIAQCQPAPMVSKGKQLKVTSTRELTTLTLTVQNDILISNKLLAGIGAFLFPGLCEYLITLSQKCTN